MKLTKAEIEAARTPAGGWTRKAGKRTVAPGTEYYTYIRSDAWRAVKQRYLGSRLSKHCYICAAPWASSFVFHHRTYKNLGCERLMDIVPICRPCHDAVHARVSKGVQLWRATTGLRRVRRKAVKAEKIARLKRR